MQAIPVCYDLPLFQHNIGCAGSWSRSRSRRDKRMSDRTEAAGLAALSICEAILLSLTENAIIDEAEARGTLSDAATAHREAVPLADGDAGMHAQAAALIEAIRDGGNSVRHADRAAPTSGGEIES
jgi:hypothetical protein